MIVCGSLVVSTDLQFAFDDDKVYEDAYGPYAILSHEHVQAVVDQAEDIGWNWANQYYSFYCGALVKAASMLSCM